MYSYNEFDEAFVRARVAQFTHQVERRIDGSLTEEEFRPLRLMNGLYLQLHAYMLRVAIPYGTLNPHQMRQLAFIADSWDKGYGHFTTRQNIQFNWPKLPDVPKMLSALADVGMHALTDAVYGALAEGDIGRHFPPSDPQWKGAESHIFLRHAVGLMRARGYELGNCDVTLVCERPKIGPHAAAMQEALAGIMGVDVGRVSVKATTSERLGFTGREEGIAALATACLVRA